MDPVRVTERQERVRYLVHELERLFPDAGIELTYANPLELLIAVILSAQCTDTMVNRVTESLFQKYKTLEDYRKASREEFEQDIRSTGFYRSKAKNIVATATLLHERFGGEVPRTMEAMLTLPGVARKTANVVLGNAYGIVEGIAVDTHVRRFALKFDLTDYTDPVRIERDLMQIVPRDLWLRFTYLVINYGRYYCPARKHDCTEHPLTKLYPQAAQRWPKAR